MLKTWVKMDWNYSGSLGSAKSEERIPAPASFTRNRLHLFYRPKQTVLHGSRSHDSQNENAISIWLVSFGRVHSEIHGTDMRLTSNWQFITNTTLATQSRLGR